MANIYSKRSADVESTFGFLKVNLVFRRFSVRGKEKVKNELESVLIAVNLRKIAVYTNAIKLFFMAKWL